MSGKMVKRHFIDNGHEMVVDEFLQVTGVEINERYKSLVVIFQDDKGDGHCVKVKRDNNEWFYNEILHRVKEDSAFFYKELVKVNWHYIGYYHNGCAKRKRLSQAQEQALERIARNVTRKCVEDDKIAEIYATSSYIRANKRTLAILGQYGLIAGNDSHAYLRDCPENNTLIAKTVESFSDKIEEEKRANLYVFL